MADNVIVATFENNNYVKTRTCYRYDYGMKLMFDGIDDLPDNYEVHFSNSRTVPAVTMIGGEDGVSIPDECFQSADRIFAWLYLHSGEDDGYTAYEVEIPLNLRPEISDETPTPEERSAISQLIVAMNSAVRTAQISAQSASVDANLAIESAESASSAKKQAIPAANRAENSALLAERSATRAEAVAEELSGTQTQIGDVTNAVLLCLNILKELGFSEQVDDTIELLEQYVN